MHEGNGLLGTISLHIGSCKLCMLVMVTNSLLLITVSGYLRCNMMLVRENDLSKKACSMHKQG